MRGKGERVCAKYMLIVEYPRVIKAQNRTMKAKNMYSNTVE